MIDLRLLLPAAMIAGLALAAPAIGAGGDPPPPPSADTRKDDPPQAGAKKEKRSDWRDGYRVAVGFIQGGRYDEAIATLAALDKPGQPDVENYLGYANRRMGRMDQARVHYEAALALDPDHRGALEYYGEWHVEMGRIDAAQTYLTRLAALCGTTCQEYQDLAEAIAAKRVH